MKRFSSTRSVLTGVLVTLLSICGALQTSPAAIAATAPATDLRVQAIYFQKTDNTSRRALVLSSMSAWQGGLWTEFLASWDTANRGLKVYTTTPKGLPDEGHVFVVLGSALSRSGKATTKVVRRLKVAHAALVKYPKSKVLVSGGGARNGHTEAAVMRDWLVAKGINPARILVEATSSSTVSNATNSMAILSKLKNCTSYTIVSDASHIRRATILFNAAKVRIQELAGKPWSITSVANVAYSDSSIASRGPVPAATHTIIASNVASVFGLGSRYSRLLSSPPASPKLTSIRLTAPKALTYQVGQKLDPTGMVVTALFNNGYYSKPVTSKVAITGFDSSKVGTVAVKVAYQANGVVKTAKFSSEIVRAATRVVLKPSTSRIRKSHTRVVVKATLGASASEVTPRGVVKFYLDGKKLKTMTLEASQAGVVRFRFPTISRTGKHQLMLKYSGSSKLKGAKQVLTVKVHK